MKRLVIFLLSLCFLSGVAFAAPDSNSRIYVVDAARGPTISGGKSGLTLFVPLNHYADFHNGLAPKIGEDVIGFGDFTRAATGWYIHPDGYLAHAAANEPRIARYGTKAGLYFEPGTTNHAKRSEEFNLWGQFNVGVTAEAIAGPHGLMVADQIHENGDNNQHHCSFSIDGYFPENTVITYSVYAKANERTWIRLLGRSYESGFPAAFFDLANGVVGTLSGGSDYGIADVGNGWYRCWMSFSTSSGGGTLTAYVGLADADNSSSYQGDGTSSLYAWGYQAEPWPYPTSHLVTSAVTAVRTAWESSQPEYTLPGGVFDGTSAKGTLVLLWCPLFDYDTIPQAVYEYGIVSVKANSATSLLRFHKSADPNGRMVTIDSANTAPWVTINWTYGNWYKLAVKWGYLTSGQSKFNVGWQNGTSMSWATEGDFVNFNTTGGVLEFAPQTTIAPFLVRDVRVYNRVLSDAEILQIPGLP